MKVKELIKHLENCDPETLILVDGYEGGFCDIGGIKKTKVELNVHSEDYYGPHDETPKANTEAYLIGRVTNP